MVKKLVIGQFSTWVFKYFLFSYHAVISKNLRSWKNVGAMSRSTLYVAYCSELELLFRGLTYNTQATMGGEGGLKFVHHK